MPATCDSCQASKQQMDAAGFLNGWQAIHLREVTMRRSKTRLLVLALTAVVLAAWAGDDAAVDRQQSDKDKSVVAPAQPAKEPGKQDRQAPPSGDKEEQAPESRPRTDRAPQSRDRVEQVRQSGSRDANAHEFKPDAIQAPASRESREVHIVPSAAAEGRPIVKGESNRPPSGGGRGGPGGGGHGGYGGGPGHDPFDRRPSHFFGGHGWHGHHDEWRHRYFHDSWRFLFHLGPVIYFAPIHYPHVIRIPHDRVGVYVRYTGEDAVGARFAESVRDHLREEGMRVVYSQDDARLELYVISMEQDPDEPGYGSAISVSYVWYPGHKFITAQMVDAGLDEVDDLAESVASYADQLVEDYR